MKLLDLTLASPAENLACDEALLDRCEDGAGEETLRFWEPREYFVVVGYADKVATEVNVAACTAHGVPMLRRCSGGGTVLQGPGCLNYALLLRITDDGSTRTISASNRFVMERNRAAMEDLLIHTLRSKTNPSPGLPATLSPSDGERAGVWGASGVREPSVRVQGHTDIAIAELKFSGNSQRRRRRFLLFHGTILLDFDIPLVEALLSPPSKQPDYRRNRSHKDFLTNFPLPSASVKAALANAWNATASVADFPRDQTAALAREKYATRAWSFRF
jgi:lipoate-protein ligase A